MSYQSYCITTLACSLNGEVGGGGKVKDDLLNTVMQRHCGHYCILNKMFLKGAVHLLTLMLLKTDLLSETQN